MPAIESGLLVDDPEQRFLLEDALRFAEEQEGTRVERVVEHRQQARLQLALEVDQDVAATDQIEAQEGRVLHQILAREDHRIAQALVDLVAVAMRREMGADAVAIHVCEVGRGKNATPCQSHRVEVDVGGEDLQAILVEGGAQPFGEQDGQ